MTQKEQFTHLCSVNVNGHIEKKKGGNGIELSYLSWPWAVEQIQKNCEQFSYEIVRQPDGLPYVYDPMTGYMVTTRVTIDGVTREMWLPVMDGANKAMKSEPYTYQTRYGEKTVEAATMFDINTAIMRCLVKNLAMFGLGLYIYAGEDIPQDYASPRKAQAPAAPPTPPADLDEAVDAAFQAADVPSLMEIWKKYRHLQGYPVFFKAVQTRNNELQ